MRLLGLGAGLLPLLLLGCGDAGHDRGRNVYFSSEDGVSGEGLAQDQADWPVAEPYPEDLVRPSPPPAPEPRVVPAAPAPDRVVAQLSDHAAYWHGGWD